MFILCLYFDQTSHRLTNEARAAALGAWAFVASSDFLVTPHTDVLHADTTLDGEEGDVLVDGPAAPLPTGDHVAAFSVPYDLVNDNIVFDLYDSSTWQ